jgi:hypothetical protein
MSPIVKPVGLIASAFDNGFDDNFNGSGPLNPARWSTYIDAAVPTDTMVPSQTAGRYRKLVDIFAGDPTLWYNADQARLDYQTLTFPFEAIAYNVGIGLPGDSQAVPVPGVDMVAEPYAFCGVLIHIPTLTTASYRSCVFGHRGPTAYTIEQKNTLTGVSNVVDQGPGVLPLGRGDLRIVGNAPGNTLDFFYRQPGTPPWVAVTEAGFSNPEPLPASVEVGLVTYAFGFPGSDFVGTCDEWRVISNGA